LRRHRRTPIHPFKLEQRAGVEDVKPLVDRVVVGDAEKGDTRVVDPKVVQQIWQDFAPYRAG
jgi:hypothetical protein